MCVCVRESARIQSRDSGATLFLACSPVPPPAHCFPVLGWGLGGGRTLILPSPLSTHFLGNHKYLLIMLTTCILPKSLLHSDQNYCNRLFARVSHASPCLTPNHNLPSIFMPMGHTPSDCNVGMSFPLCSFSIC